MSASSSSSSSPPDAAALFKQGDFLGALKAYQAALAAGGDPGPLQRNLAAVYLRLELWPGRSSARRTRSEPAPFRLARLASILALEFYV